MEGGRGMEEGRGGGDRGREGGRVEGEIEVVGSAVWLWTLIKLACNQTKGMSCFINKQDVIFFKEKQNRTKEKPQ